MATIAAGTAKRERHPDVLSGTPRAHAIDRWIFVFMAAWFIAIVLAGFIPDSIEKVASVQSGERPPFPLVLHIHAVLMGSFLLVLLAQTTLAATGKIEQHRRLGLAGMMLAPALVIAGFVLVPTNHHLLWKAVHAAAPAQREDLLLSIRIWENIMLLQIWIGLAFALFIAIGLKARGASAGLHKRMMILAVAMPLPAGFDRIPWLPSTMPFNPLSAELYVLLAVAPMLIWDVVRNRRVHRAYWIFLGVNVPVAIMVNTLWDLPVWHATARALMGV
jgi:heme/copper-type cytochrome/quinol oxidase subunit 3